LFIIRICICTSVEISSFFGGLIPIARAFLGMASIFFIYISIAEMVLIYSKRADSQKKVYKNNSVKLISINAIVDMVSRNDIIEIEILSPSMTVIKAGASSDSKYTEKQFFNKLYYIDRDEYKTIDEFCAEISCHSKDGFVKVVAVDGCAP